MESLFFLKNENFDNSLKNPVILRRISLFSASISIIICVMGLLSYLPGLRIIGSLNNDYIPMAPSTAISFLIMDLIIIFIPYFIKIDFFRRISYFLISSLLFFILSIFFSILFNKRLNPENYFFPISETLNGIPIGKMSPSTALFFIFIAFTMLLLIKSLTSQVYDKYWLFIGIISIITTFSSLIFILAYLYGNPLLYNQGFTIPMALTTALSFLMLNISIITSCNQNSFPLKFFLSGNTQSKLLSTFLPISVFCVFLESILLTISSDFIEINKAFLSAIMIVIATLITVVSVSLLSRKTGILIDNNEQIRLQALLLNLQEGIIMLSENYSIMFMNNLAKRYLDLISTKYEIYQEHTDYRKLNLMSIDHWENSNGICEVSIENHDMIFELSINEIDSTRTGNGNILLIRDITERYNSLKLIKKFSKIIEQALNSIIITNEEGIVEYINMSFLNLSGFKLHELIGHNYDITLKKESKEKFNSAFKEILLSRDSWKAELQHSKSNGESYWVSVYITKLFDENNTLLNYFIIEDDITSIKELTIQLKEKTSSLFEEKIKIESILNNIPFGVSVIQDNKEIIFLNNSFSSVVFNEYDIQLQIGEKIDNYKNIRLFEIILLKIERLENHSEIITIGSSKWELSLTFIKTENLKNIIIIILRDITEVIEFELLQKQFVATVTHELRTPITSIQLSINNYRTYFEQLTDAQKSNLITMISQSSSILKNKIQDLLILSKIDLRSLEFRKIEKFNIIIEIQNAILATNSQLEDKNMSTSLIHKGDLFINGDKERFRQILRIALENSIKYSFKDNGIIITVKDKYFGKYNKNKTLGVLICIKDFGIGIPSKEISLIGNRFFRGTNVTHIEGTGIGLSILKEILSLFKGDYYIKSIEGKGTSLILFFPITEENSI